MRKLFLIWVMAALVIVNAKANTDPITTKVDIAKSEVSWKGYKVTGQHHGKIALKDGSLTWQDGVLTGGSFTIDMSSITCEDLEGEWNGKLVGHLKSDDFFGVEKFPVAQLEITQVISRGTPGDYKIVGDLTIKGITKEVRFMAKVNPNQATAAITVDRSEFNVRYGSGSFFENLGDKTIYDEFELEVNLTY
ncbi:MAG: YceI family protein [Saprospiraceae bacterium]